MLVADFVLLLFEHRVSRQETIISLAAQPALLPSWLPHPPPYLPSLARSLPRLPRRLRQEGTAPELLYKRFTSEDRTSILAQVFKGKVDVL